MPRYAALTILTFLLSVPPAWGELRHRYSFNDGTANDAVGGAHGKLANGAIIEDGQLVLKKGANGFNGGGDYASLDAEKIGINKYKSLTLELWVTVDPVLENMWVIGATLGKAGGVSSNLGFEYVAIQLCRDSTYQGDQAAISGVSFVEESRVQPDDDDLADGAEHYLAITVDHRMLTYYVDGKRAGAAPIGDVSLADLSNQDAFLGRSLFSGDQTLIGSINEFRIWDEVKDEKHFKQTAADGPNKLETSPENATAKPAQGSEAN